MTNPFPNASAAFKRLNPGLFGLGAVETHQPKSAPAPSLDRPKAQRKRRPCRVEILLCAHLRRNLDDDNLAGACKPLRDAIAATLGLDDADPRLTWNYHQVLTKGTEGVQVTIRMVE